MGIKGSKKSKKDISSKMNGEADPLTAQVHQKYFDFGKPCNTCLKTKLNGKNIYCLHCLRVKCLWGECSSESDCNMFQSSVKERVLELTSAIWKMINYKRKNQTIIQEKCMLIEQIHSTHVQSTITITKRFEPDSRSEEEQLLDNCIEICVNDVTDKRNEKARYTVIVRLDDLKYQSVCVFQKCGTNTELEFIDQLEKYLKNEPVRVVKMDDCLRNQNDLDRPLILVCLHQSRINDDVKYTLEGIECKHFRRILLILLHFKKNHSDYEAKNIEKCYSGMQVIDYFQQEPINNIEEVLKQVKDFIF